MKVGLPGIINLTPEENEKCIRVRMSVRKAKPRARSDGETIQPTKGVGGYGCVVYVGERVIWKSKSGIDEEVERSLSNCENGGLRKDDLNT